MRPAARWFLSFLGGLLALIAIGGAAIWGLSERRFRAVYAPPVEAVSIPSSPEAVARGRHLLTLSKCGECHGDDLGGKVILDQPGLARLSGPNLTPGPGGVSGRADAELVRALRVGLDTEGRPLLGMPTGEHFYFSDRELGAIIAALRSLPPVARETPPDSVGPLFRLLFLADQIELVGAEEVDLGGPRPAEVLPGEGRDYGEHLARTGGCMSCHGAALSGGPMAGAPPDWPPASNITPDVETGLGAWSRADFARAMREGLRPDGGAIDPAMPVRYTREMTDAEINALWAFLQEVAPAPYGGG